MLTKKLPHLRGRFVVGWPWFRRTFKPSVWQVNGCSCSLKHEENLDAGGEKKQLLFNS